MKTKRIIFTITTGRSGTQYLTYLMRYLSDATVVHEHEPSFLKYIYADEAKRMNFLQNEKMPFIQSQKTDFYIETSHLFAKGYLLPMINLGYKPDIIFLKRENRAVAKSIYKLNHIPIRTTMGKKYYPITETINLKKLTDYQLCFLYTLQMDKIMNLSYGIAKNMGFRTVSVKFEELFRPFILFKLKNNLELKRIGLWNMLRYFRFQLRKVKLNNKSEFKTNSMPDVDFAKEENQLLEQLLKSNLYVQ